MNKPLSLTGVERTALLLILECPFTGDDDDLSAVVGPGRMRAALEMRRKVRAWLVGQEEDR